MSDFLSRLFDTSVYETLVDRYRALVIYAVTLLVMVVYVLYAVAVAEWFLPSDPDTAYTMADIALIDPTQPPAIVFYSLFVIGLLGFLANRRGMLRVAAWVPVSLWYISGVLLITLNTRSPGETTGAIVLLVVLAGLLLGFRGVLFAFIASILPLLLRAQDLGAVYTTGRGMLDLSNVLLQLTGGALLVMVFLRYARLNRREGAIEAVEDRRVTADILTEIAQQVARRTPLQELLGSIVTAINQRFDFVYHTQVFLVDDGSGQALLTASTGEVGEKLLARGHRLTVGSESVIGRVTASGEVVIARAGSRDSVHKRNELLPETVVEAAFPLRIGDRVIGALDVQSRDAEAFNDENIVATFQAFADSLTLAIDNLDQFEKAEAREEENIRLIDETRDALREVERLNERLTGRAWSEYLRGSNRQFGLAIDFDNDSVQRSAEWTPILEEAANVNHIVQGTEGDRQMIAVPLSVRGRVIGAMEFELDAAREFSPEDYNLLQEVGERFGLAVENARLVDESQRVAQREALVNQITTRLQSSNEVEGMLQEAARGLKDALKAGKVAIRLGTPPHDDAGES